MENKIINTTETDNGFTIKVEIINFTPYGKTGFVEDFRTFMSKKGLNIKNTKETYPLNGVNFTFVDLTYDQLNLIRDKIFEYNNDMEYNETINTNKLYTTINEFKQHLYENKTPQDIAELYDTYGDKYPYATDAISYFVFGYNEPDNIIKNSIDGVYGKNTSIDYVTINDYMLQYENGWYDYIEDIEEFVKNLPTEDGEILSYYY